MFGVLAFVSLLAILSFFMILFAIIYLYPPVSHLCTEFGLPANVVSQDAVIWLRANLWIMVQDSHSLCLIRLDSAWVKSIYGDAKLVEITGL